MKQPLLSLTYDDCSAEEWEEMLRDAITAHRTAALYTPNAEIAYRCERDPGFCACLARGTFLAPDGEGIILGAKLAGSPMRHGKRAGVELGMTVARLCAETGEGLYLYGGREGVAELAADRLRAQLPGLKIAGMANGYDTDPDDVARAIAESGAGAVLVCLGSPKQERWIEKNRAQLPALLCALGGSMDVYAGVVRRAPSGVIAAKCEWLWRLLRQPSRIGRMAVIPRFLLRCAGSKRERK